MAFSYHKDFMFLNGSGSICFIIQILCEHLARTHFLLSMRHLCQFIITWVKFHFFTFIMSLICLTFIMSLSRHSVSYLPKPAFLKVNITSRSLPTDCEANTPCQGLLTLITEEPCGSRIPTCGQAASPGEHRLYSSVCIITCVHCHTWGRWPHP